MTSRTIHRFNSSTNSSSSRECLRGSLVEGDDRMRLRCSTGVIHDAWRCSRDGGSAPIRCAVSTADTRSETPSLA